LRLKFWGVRGSLATPCRQNLGFGGNTTCLQVEVPHSDEVVIFDAGTGIRNLGLSLMQSRQGPLKIHLLLTHFHWDHVLGLPFFGPAFDPRNSLTIYSSPYSAPLMSSITGVLSHPYFPATFESELRHVKLMPLERGESLRIAGVEIRAFPVQHPQGACGYRIESSGACIVFVPDHEGGDAEMDRAIREAAHGADVLIHDSQYTPEEYLIKKGWGHSTWKDAAQVALDSQIGRLVLFHHDPAHDDDMVQGMLESARDIFPNADAAIEGSVIEI
jgi:phosphoribosyl 1,2-cyclic phosphodiesterase